MLGRSTPLNFLELEKKCLEVLAANPLSETADATFRALELLRSALILVHQAKDKMGKNALRDRLIDWLEAFEKFCPRE